MVPVRWVRLPPHGTVGEKGEKEVSQCTKRVPVNQQTLIEKYAARVR